jgi:hypothetical protein
MAALFHPLFESLLKSFASIQPSPEGDLDGLCRIPFSLARESQACNRKDHHHPVFSIPLNRAASEDLDGGLDRSPDDLLIRKETCGEKDIMN